MAKAFSTWTVLPHGPIRKHSSNFWSVPGTMPNPSITRVMSIARLGDGRLVVYNSVALEDAAMRELDAWGTVAFIVVPSGSHRQDARIFKDRYPTAKVVAPPGARRKVEQVVPVDLLAAEAFKDPGVELRPVAGAADAEAILRTTAPEGTWLVFNDVVGNMALRGGLLGYALGPTGRPSVPRFARWALVKDKAALAADLRGLAALPGLAGIIVSHGSPITENPAGILRGLADELGT